VALVETVEEAMQFQPKDPQKLAFATQTTLSVDDTAAIVAVLQERFPAMAAPHKEDICYATTNRQDAVKRLAQGSDLLLVIGSQNSSNSVRLVEVGLRAGARAAQLIDDATRLDWQWLEGVSSIGITAGASAPERLVEGLIEALNTRFDVTVEEINPVRETVTFKLPRLLSEGPDASGA
jgi:4-hydroxy-3-methylbut-2-enyl diphosphate reductase